MTNSYQNILIREYDYELTPERIAAFPLAERDQSKLLVYRNGSIIDEQFARLDQQLPENSLLILNDTRVIEARILFQKTTGGQIEIFCLEPFQQSIEQSLTQQHSVQWNCLIGGASKWKPGQVLVKQIGVGDVAVRLTAKYISRQSDSFIIEFNWTPGEISFAEVIHNAGAIPLPPYIRRAVVSEDKERYQTIFSKHEGSVAAPTAALHFSEKVFNSLEEKHISIGKITLHVGAGTFKPVKTEDVAEHIMHEEPFTVSKKVLEEILSAPITIAVGTTSLRTLESIYWMGLKLMKEENTQWKLAQWEAYELDKKYPDISDDESIRAIINYMTENNLNLLHCRTSLIIVPGYRFRIPSALVTNFHQPQSTLLLLVSAFIGEDWKKVYKHAMENNYRFLSYGDSSLLWKKD
jgi:S-adenosylmethionine:tRNA ribosyltransferase-isomerase